jgi:hypothetical protein
MIKTTDQYLLMIEPASIPTSANPVLDSLTKRLTTAWRTRQSKNRYRGMHYCTGRGCSAMSDNQDHIVLGRITHSLCIHYLAHHREDLSEETLQELDQILPREESDPTPQELGERIQRYPMR